MSISNDAYSRKNIFKKAGTIPFIQKSIIYVDLNTSKNNFIECMTRYITKFPSHLYQNLAEGFIDYSD